jgi:hypothetical protein
MQEAEVEAQWVQGDLVCSMYGVLTRADKYEFDKGAMTGLQVLQKSS